MKKIYKILQFFSPLIDIVILFFIIPSSIVMKFYRKFGTKRLKLSTTFLSKVGVMPIINHYYEPYYKYDESKSREKRSLPGIRLNIDNQLELLKKLNYQDEFINFVESQKNNTSVDVFKINDSSNGSFESGDAEFLYAYLRNLKPKKVIEIGCGQSTKIISKALSMNQAIDNINFEHTCVEPYEMPWLNNFQNIQIIRNTIEDLDFNWKKEIQDGDMLFIDSSHIIKPYGDVLCEFLEIIPVLKPGVHVHVHDIFTPYNYIDQFLKDEIKYWNEQYILEATLSKNSSYEVTASLNYLKNNYYDDLKKICPYLNEHREPGSFYFKIV